MNDRAESSEAEGTPSFLDLAGSIPVPADKRDAAWDDIIRRTRLDRAAARR